MRRIRKILLALLVLFLVIQFSRPAHNTTKQVLATDFNRLFVVPDTMQAVLQNACYDCHSNNTLYPWYSNIQPIAWIIARDIKKGKEQLNFSDFGSYGSRRQISKLKEIANQVKDDEMPITAYKLMHIKARLSQGQKLMIIEWMQKTADALTIKN